MTEMSLSIFFLMVVVTITAARSTGDERKEVTLSIQAKASEEGVEGTLELTGGTNSDSENDTAEGGSSKDDQKLEDEVTLSIQAKASEEGVEGTLELTGGRNSDSENDTAEGGSSKDDQKLEDKHLSEEMGEFRREWKQSNRYLVDQLQTLQANSCNASNESHGEYREAGANSTSNASCNSGDISQLEARIEALISKIETDISTSSMTGSTNLTRGGPNAWGTACEQRERSESKSFSKICFENNVQNHTQGSDTIVCGTKWKASLQCGLGIGIHSAGIVVGGHLSQSSYSHVYTADNGRLSSDYGWCPKHARVNEYVGVYLTKRPTQSIHGVIVQGIGNGAGIPTHLKESFVTTYKVTYVNSEEEWVPVTDESGAVMIFGGTVDDKDTPIVQKFPQPVAAKSIRIYVVTWYRWPCLRFEFLTC